MDRDGQAWSGERRRLHRRPDRALVGGVCAGVAEYLEVEPLVVRVCFVVLVAASGIGAIVYPLAWALMPAESRASATSSRSSWRGRLTGWREAAAIAVLVLLGFLVLRRTGLWLGGPFVQDLMLASLGLALILRQARASEWTAADPPREDANVESAESAEASGPRWRRWPGGVLGVVLIAGAAVLFLHDAGILVQSRRALGAIAVILVAVGLVSAPWFVRLARNLSSERSQRIRSQERAELAAHLHDSVLQTLALIQRRADDPRAVAGLARRQERELRHWLLARSDGPAPATLATALEQAAAEAEALHGVRIELVSVGDCPLDERLEATVAAAGEALSNAAKFAGEQQIDLYAEVCAERVQVFVRDRGPGFDPAAIPADRRGVRYSILERMRRHGGRAEIHAQPGQGTEIELVMERQRP